MTEQRLYVLPTTEADAVGFCSRAIASLTNAGVLAVSAAPPVNLAEFAPGPAAGDHFRHSFESLGVRLGVHPRLLPEEPAIDARCPQCAEDLNERWYERVDEESERNEEQDWSVPRISCPACAWKGGLAQVSDGAGVGAFTRREFLFFDGVRLDAAALRELGDALRRLLGAVTLKHYGAPP